MPSPSDPDSSTRRHARRPRALSLRRPAARTPDRLRSRASWSERPLSAGALERTRIAVAAAAAAVLLIPAAVLSAGCSSTTIWARETILGQAKRDQLVGAVVEARDEQQEAKETFSSALEELLALSSGAQTTADLEAQHRLLESAYDRSVGKADRVRDRVASVERVAGSLFREWEAELDEYESATLREKSADQLAQTRDLSTQLISAMNDAAATMDPVLSAFKDQTLFLKHNLNARAIASLQTDLEEIRVDVANLIAEMEAAIAEADAFISAVQGA